MKLLVHITVELTDDGKVVVHCPGYSVRGRQDGGPLTTAHLQSVADAVLATVNPGPYPPAEHPNGSSPPGDHSVKNALSQAIACGVTAEAARRMIQDLGPKRVDSAATFVLRRVKEGDVANPAAMLTACLRNTQ